jgi:SpoVK/Ycf46/Vps4 family AAA+-type ATPase
MDIFRLVLQSESLEESVDLKHLAVKAKNYSGSDIKNLCVAAALNSLRRAKNEFDAASSSGSEETGLKRMEGREAYCRKIDLMDFHEAFREIGPSVSDQSTCMAEMREWQKSVGNSVESRIFGF